MLFLLLLPLALFPLAHAFDGPLQVKNQFPLFRPVYTPTFEKAIIENSFSAGFSYSSMYLVRKSAGWSAGLDMEIAELDLRLRKNIRTFVEFSIDLPIISFTSGFMDDFLSGYHDAFGFPDYGRSGRPHNKFLYEVRKDGHLILRGENGRMGVGDIRLALKKPILTGDPAVSVRVEVEIPTGDAESGFGNGTFDAGLSLLIGKKVGEKVRTYFNLGVVSPGDLKGYERVYLDEFIHAGAALEAMLWKDISVIGQTLIQGSPFPKTAIGQIDRTAVLFSLGGRYHSSNNSFEFSLTEDPNTAGAPDVMFNVMVKRKF